MTYSKYRAKRTDVDGISFDSKAEARRYEQLAMLQRCGNIAGLECHVRYPLTVNGVKVGYYEADFVYRDGGATVVEDVKGVLTPVYRLKKKLMLAIHGIEIQEVQA